MGIVGEWNLEALLNHSPKKNERLLTKSIIGRELREPSLDPLNSNDTHLPNWNCSNRSQNIFIQIFMNIFIQTDEFQHLSEHTVLIRFDFKLGDSSGLRDEHELKNTSENSSESSLIGIAPTDTYLLDSYATSGAYSSPLVTCTCTCKMPAIRTVSRKGNSFPLIV